MITKSSIAKNIKRLKASLKRPAWSSVWNIAYKHGKIDALEDVLKEKDENMDAIIKRVLNKLKKECKFGVKPRSNNGKRKETDQRQKREMH